MNLNLKQVSEVGGTYTPADNATTGERVKDLSGSSQPPVHIDKTCAWDVNFDNLAQYSGKIVTLELTNTNAPGGDTLFWILGTSLGVLDEVVGAGVLAATLFQGNASAVASRIGVTAPQASTLAARAVRNQMILTRIEFLTAVDTSGLLQRQQPLTRLGLTPNLDNCDQGGKFPVFWTDANGVVENVMIPIGDEHGIQYPILADETVSINLTIGAHMVPTMANTDGTC